MKQHTEEIVQEFLGRLNDVPIRDKDVFYTVGYLLDVIHENDLKFNNEIIKELAETIYDVKISSEHFDMQELEQELTSEIEDGRLSTPYEERKFEFVNDLFQELNKED